MCKTNTGKIVAFLVAVLLAVAIFSSLAAPAEAAGNASKVIVFTDKKVYLTWWMNAKTTVPAFRILQKDNDISPYIFVYAVVLDDDGNIMKGRTVQVTLNDTVFDHYEKANWNVHTSMVANNTYFTNTINMNDTGTFNDSIASDGLYTTTIAMSPALLTDVQSAPRLDDHIRLKLTVKDTASGLNSTTYVLVSWGKCHQGPGLNHPAHVTTTASDICTNCHGGYEHFFESVSGTIPDDYLDVHFKVLGDSLPDSTMVVKGMQEYRWNTTQADDPLLDVSWKNESGGGAVYCLFCHQDPAGSNWFDYGTGGRTVLTDRPSCSQGTSGYSGGGDCHSSTEIESATVTPWTQGGALASTNDTLQGINNQKAHNHTGNKANVSCTLCHAVPHGLTMPNMSVDISSTGVINDQCVVCHNISGGLNITANGGRSVNHTKTECKNCHVDNNLLNAHLVPVGVFGGKWCLNCHNQTGKAPINMKVDPAIINISNQDYIHDKLNNRSDATNSSRICWGCHTNNSVAKNGRVNSTNLSIDEHPGGYDTPRNCTSCHNNSNATINFSAPQTYRHTWYAPNMKTSAVNFCPDCHSQDEELNAWNEEIYPPKTDNESSAHYGRNRSAFFGLLGAEYCAYCHQNESTVMGPFANPNNEVRSDHASQNTTPGCGNANCHNEGRMHENTLTLPNFTESNINTTCMACHSTGNYSYHNNTLTCWDCHMGNVSTINEATWIHPIQFVQYNGNFTGAKLTSATCYDCHKSVRVDNVTQYLSGKAAPKVNNQAHSNDPNNGTKWGDYWKYTPTTYEFASYEIIGGNGSIDPGHPFENIMVPSNEYMQLNETKIGSGNGSTVPVNKNERQVNGPPVPNWTSSTLAGGTTTGGTVSASQDATKGNPAGSLKAYLKTGSGAGTYYGYVSWNYSFYYKPNTTYGFTYTNASVDYNITVGTALTQNVYLRIVKPSGAIVTLASNSSTNTSGWATLTNNSFASALTEDGSVTPYKLSLYTELQGVKTSKTYTVNYDNVLLKFQEKVWNRYEIVINTTGVPVNGSSKLGLSYQAHKENTSLMIYNKTSGVYELLDLMNKGVFFDYTKDINSTHHINSVNGITGNVSVKFVDDDQGDTDAVSDVFHIRYLYVFTDRGLQYPCEQCHSPNKHYVNPTIGSPDKFNASNKYNTTDLRNSTWCQQCHWQGAANYSKMILEFNKTRNPPENIPPEITGNATYGNYSKYGGKSKDGTTTYINHTGSGFGDMSDFGCFQCHGKAGDTTSAQFVHNVQAGSSGGRNCTACHNIGGSKNNVNFTAVNMSMHGKLNSGASSTPANASNKPCWGCHGTKNGTYANESDQPENDHNSTYYKNPRKCADCHITGSLQFTTKNVTDHIPSGYTASTDVNTSSYNYTYCSYCHNNSVNSAYEPDSMGLSSGTSPMNASVSHYGANKTAGKLMYNTTGNTEDCVYCHRNSSNMAKWGIQQGSRANISNKNASGGGTSHDIYTSSGDCSQCHGGYVVTGDFTFHNSALGPGAGGGPDCKNCHDTGSSGSAPKVNFSVLNNTNAIHRNLNSNATASVNAENRKCWACHGNGEESTGHHTSLYACLDCHNRTDNLTFTTNTTIKTGLNKTKVSEHIQQTYENITSTRNNSAVNCTYCHTQSLLGFTDTASINVNSNVSHYATKTSLVSPTANCNLCHKAAANASKYYANVTRHPAKTQDVYYCRYCHNTTNASSLHSRSIDFLYGSQASIHGGTNGVINYWGFDWEEDDWNEANVPRTDEGCQACHKSGQPAKLCENCHLPDGNSRFTGPRKDTGLVLNASINNSIPRVYSHTNYSTVNVRNQSVPGQSVPTSCYGFGGNMTCHGVDYNNRSKAGGYFAYNLLYGLDAWKSDPSHFTNTIDRLPDTSKCLFCHNQSNTTIRAAWGNAFQVNASNMYGATTNESCYTCHTSDKSTPVDFHANTLIRSVNGNPNCVSCHNVSGNYSNVDFPAINNSMHGSLNAQASSTPANATNKPCWGCHGTVNGTYANESDQPANDHNVTFQKNPRKCADCHITGSLQFTTKNVTDHIPSGYAGTDVNTSSYNYTSCSFCHNNSVNVNNDPDGMGLATSVSPANASVSHYGANKTAGKLMYNSTGNTEDCVYCHRNSSNQVKWGILPGSLANISNKNSSGGGFNHNSYTQSNQCSTCHGSYADTPGFTFHDASLGNGSGGGSGPNCKSCHNISDSDTGRGHIDYTVYSASIHGGINTTAGADENEPCWACHGSGISEGHNTTGDSQGKGKFNNPYICADCHTSTGARNAWAISKGALNVSEHYANGSKIKASYNATATFSCLKCHQDMGEMMLPNGDTDYNKTSWSQGGDNYNATIGGNKSPYHYGAKRSTLNGSAQNTDGYCNYCHSNISSVFPYVNQHNKSIFEHTNTTNTSVDIRNTTSLNCNSPVCHGSGRLHNISLNKTAQTAWTSGQKDYCAPCHNSTGGASKKVSNQWHDPLNSSTDNITNCNYCHDSGSLGSTVLSYSLNVHSDNLTYPSNAVNCTGCHNVSSTYVKGKKILTHFPNASKDKGNTSLSARTCEACHGITGKSMHASGLVKKPSYGCADCHKSSGSGPYWANQSFNSYIDTTSHDNTSTSNVTNCEWCHNSSGAKAPFHFTSFANGSVSDPKWGGWQAGSMVNCTNCHDSSYNNQAPFYAPAKPHAGTGNNTDDCYSCHTNVNTYAAAPLAVHAVVQAPGNANCTKCHDTGGAASKKVDVAAMNKSNSIHLNLNSVASNSNATAPYATDSKRCWACHGDGSDKNEHNATRYKDPYRCEDCHTAGGSQSGKYPSFNVTEHVAGGVDIRAPNAAYCYDCHNKSEMVRANNDTAISSSNASAGHYGKKRLLDGSDYPQENTIAYCNKCHNNGTSVFPFADTANRTIANHSMNYNSTNPSCLDSSCHATGRIHNETLKMPKLPLHNSTYCTGCHTTKERHNSTGGPNSGLNCTECHLNSSKGIHPARYLEYSGTWGTTNGSAANCTSCHQGAGLNNFSKAKIVPTPMNHSTNSYAGKLWGNYWNNNSQQDSCRYCHGNVSYHNTSGLGLVLTVKGTNTVRMNFSGKWCANCHYSKAPNYSVSAFSPAPPEVTTNTTPNDPSVSWYNHSSDIAGNYTDAKCKECHDNALGSGATSLNFTHNLGAGGGGPDCATCHDTGRGNAMVSVDAIKGSMHWNLKNASATDTTGNPANKICWACHQSDGTQPAGHPDKKTNPYNCTDCHKNSSRPAYVTGALQVTNHFKNGTNITALTGSATNDTSCTDCHLLSEMVVSYTEPDAKNNNNSLASHYGKNRSDMVAMGDDAYCNYCHSNGSTAFTFNKPHNKLIFEHTGNGTADIRNATSLNCTDCHTTNLLSYRIHNSTLKNPQASVWTSGKQDRCAPCHKAAGSGSNLKVNNTYHNTTGSITDCGYCHNGDAMKAGNAPQNIHSDNLTAGGNSSYFNCYNCHQNGFASKVIIEHTNNSGANTTNASMTCARGGCHISNKTHSAALVKPAVNNWTAGGNDYCAPCHNSSDSVTNATKKVYNQGHNPTNRTNDNITSCGNCHNASTPGAIPVSFRLHDTSMTKSPVEPNASTCQGCHNGTSLFVGAGKQIFSHIPNASQYRGNTTTSSYTCEYCHNMTNKPSMHSTGMNRSNGTCETCHLNNTSPFKSTMKNLTQMAGMLNHSYNGSLNTTCKMCHNASGRQRFHLARYASGDIADPHDSNGVPTFELRATSDPNDRGILVDCRDCHEKYNDTAPFYAPFQEANRTGQNLQEHVGKGYTLNNCYVCHTYEDNVSKPVNTHNVSIEPLSGGPNCTRCHNIGATDSGKAPGNMLVNFTVFKNYSVHRNLTNATAWNNSIVFGLIDTACWVCHQSNGKQPERHPDLKDDATLTGGRVAYRCPDCHTIGGIVSTYQPNVYQNATKIYRHYPGSVFSGNIVFNSTKQCYMCHQNSQAADINISGYSSNMDANNTNISHYATRNGLLVTNQTQNGCKECHMPGIGNEQVPKDYGYARIMPANHNKMGSSETSCQKSCHNSNSGSNITLHDMNLGVYMGTGGCYSSGCHSLPSSGSGGRRRR